MTTGLEMKGTVKSLMAVNHTVLVIMIQSFCLLHSSVVIVHSEVMITKRAHLLKRTRKNFVQSLLSIAQRHVISALFAQMTNLAHTKVNLHVDGSKKIKRSVVRRYQIRRHVVHGFVEVNVENEV